MIAVCITDQIVDIAYRCDEQWVEDDYFGGAAKKNDLFEHKVFGQRVILLQPRISQDFR